MAEEGPDGWDGGVGGAEFEAEPQQVVPVRHPRPVLLLKVTERLGVSSPRPVVSAKQGDTENIYFSAGSLRVLSTESIKFKSYF